ncbi:MAG TPA: hypothetical protein VI818_04650 [Candidatus Thermoplasmatota archaeon]|nr:hypothetical protein [Candidatus Thermoplasmatota archaeon]
MHKAIGAALKTFFPEAKAVEEWGMLGWRTRLAWEPPREAFRGTMDPRYLSVFLAERKQGITLHLWNPLDYYGLEKKKADLTKAGFKVMRGCLQFNRNSDYPVDAVMALLAGIREKVDAKH